MKVRKIGMIALAAMLFATMVGATACSGKSDESKTTTVIEFANFQGCAGDSWLKEAAARFSEAKKDESYESGKKGVKIEVTNLKSIPYESLNSSGYDIFIGENKANIYEMSSSGFLMDVGDIVSPIESSIDSDAIKRLKGADGKYYGLPFYEWYTGVTYDQDFFDEENLYFAAPEIAGRTLNSKFGSAKFTASATDKKSCGPDGIYDTYDDGLPSSLQEFLILCSVIKTDGGRSPFTIAGASLDYAFFLVDGLWASLAGADQIKTIYSLNSDGQEIVEVVTGYTNEDLFYNGSGIKRPITEKIAIDDTNGYKIYDMASRYYALSVLQVILDEGWFNEYEFNRGTLTNLTAQSNFINQNTSGMLYDASYWCSESEEQGNFDVYRKAHPDKPERNVSYMPLPVTLETTVTEGNGRKQALLDVGSAQLFVNKRVEQNEGKKKAVTDFLKFLYGKEELAAFTEKTGLILPISYEYDDTKLNDYFKKLSTIRNASDVVYYASDSQLFLKNMEAFSLTWSGAANRPVINGVEIGKGFIVAMKDYDADSKVIFETTRKTETHWAGLQR